MKKPTISQIAAAAGVSKMTVSRVVNDSAKVSERARRRIEEAIVALGFRPDPNARGLALGRADLVALIYDNPNPDYIVQLQLGIQDAIGDTRFELVLHKTDRFHADHLGEVADFASKIRWAGLILPPPLSESDAVIQRLRAAGCRYVRISAQPLDEPEAMVVTHDDAGAEAAGEEVARQGHRAVGIIHGPPDFASSWVRSDGFRRGLARHGARVDARLVREGGYTFEGGEAAALELLSLADRPTAIFAGNDEMAAGAMAAARRLGLDVPGSLSVVGFDDARLASAVWPPLTTVALPVREIGRRAAFKVLSLARPASGSVWEDPVRPILIRRSSVNRIPNSAAACDL